MSNEKCREEFERTNGGDHRRQPPKGNNYIDPMAQADWESFQKGWAQSREALEQSTVNPEVQAMISFFEAGEAEEIRMAEAFVRESERCSISALQRKFKIGYNRACRLMDKLVALKVVSPIDAEGRRTVLPEQVKS